MPTQEQKEQARIKRLKLLFNITPEEYDLILNYQNGVCFICGNPPSTKRLAVDHNHSTGEIRGLLCMLCNRAIAKFKDDATRLAKAALYLTTHPATSALGSPRFGLRGRTSNKAKTRHKLNPQLGPVPKKTKKRKRNSRNKK